ncbi:membrane protein [Streptomyces phage Doxi13]|nr:membrane protein [Streptomyces phage Doxi13]
MDFGILARRVGKVAAGNSPTILTTLGVTGTLATAYLTGKATLKAAEIIAEEQANRDYEEAPPFEFKEKVELVWKQYIPAAGIAVVTIACMVAANRIGARRVAALASAYTIAERAAVTYKDKVVETIGKKKEEAVRTAIAQEEIDRHPISRETVFVEGGGGDLFRDGWSGRYFNSTVARLEKAANQINSTLNSDFSATLSDFYDQVGLDRTDESDMVGWNSDCPLELEFTWASTPDERPCGVVRFRTVPYREHNSFH